jgi:hypothetical protein
MKLANALCRYVELAKVADVTREGRVETEWF